MTLLILAAHAAPMWGDGREECWPTAFVGRDQVRPLLEPGEVLVVEEMSSCRGDYSGKVRVPTLPEGATLAERLDGLSQQMAIGMRSTRTGSELELSPARPIVLRAVVSFDPALCPRQTSDLEATSGGRWTVSTVERCLYEQVPGTLFSGRPFPDARDEFVVELPHEFRPGPLPDVLLALYRAYGFEVDSLSFLLHPSINPDVTVVSAMVSVRSPRTERSHAW